MFRNAFADLRSDIRYAARTFRKSPVFTGVIVLSLALGIGANTALFSIFDAMFLRKLPVENPDSLVAFMWEAGPSQNPYKPNSSGSLRTGGDEGGTLASSDMFSPRLVEQFRSAETLSALAAHTGLQAAANVDGQAMEVTGQLVSGNYFPVLGVPAIRGRTISIEDDQASASPVVVISYGLWERRFALAEDVVGKQIVVNGILPVTIIGVTPADFHLGRGFSPDLSIPMALRPRVYPSDPSSWTIRVFGRMRPGVTLEQVQADLQGAFLGIALEEAPATAAPDMPRLLALSGDRGVANPLGGNRQAQETLILLLALSLVFVILLLIVGLNVANLMLARSATRQYEIGVRLAMGASRRRLIRQLLTESVMLALVGGALGAVFAYWGKDMIRVFQDTRLVLDLRVDPHALGFSALISLVTGIFFGIAPAFRATRIDVQSAVKQSGRNFSMSRPATGKALQVIQVAMSVVLLIGAGLLLRTLDNVQTADVGFDMDNLLLFRLDPGALYYEETRTVSFFDRVLERLDVIPGVVGATASSGSGPLLNYSPGGVTVSTGSGVLYAPGGLRMDVVRGPDVESASTEIRLVHIRPDFFSTVGIPVTIGRDLGTRDGQGTSGVALVNETLARRFFQNSNPVGRSITLDRINDRTRAGEERELEIVGVVQDIEVARLGTPLPALVFEAGSPNGTIVVRTASNPLTLVPAIREAIRSVDPNLPMLDIRTQTQHIAREFETARILSIAGGLFGAAAVVLTCIGLYGLLSYNVARRTNEIGIRMALGAQRFHVVRWVMAQAVAIVLIGLFLGLALSMGINQALRTLIFGVSPYDPLIIAAVSSVLLVVTAIAAFLPARRAARVDPTVALHAE